MPARFRLKISRGDYEELRRLVLDAAPRESAAFALAGIARTRDSEDIIVRRPIAITSDLYDIQEEYHLRVSPRAINGLVALCEANGLGAVICHSHPVDGISYSSTDDDGERRIAATLRQFLTPAAPVASLLFSPNRVEGRIWTSGSNHPSPLAEITVIGETITRIYPQGSPATDHHEPIYDRQVRAFGSAGQALIADARVAVVGVGGTGSPSAEQLVRLGVRDLILVDPDTFEPSNLTRVYGSFTVPKRPVWRIRNRTRSSKVHIVADHLRRISPAATVIPIDLNVAYDQAAQHLLDRDVILLCTDDHWGRSVVNQLAHQYFIPTVNVGTRISSNDDRIEHAVGVIDVLRPDLPCLWCRQFLRSERIAAESMPTDARRDLQREGYVEGVADAAPSVISLTTTLSGLAITVFLQLLTNFAGNLGNVSRLNYDALAFTLRRGSGQVLPDCVCVKVRAFGDLRGRGTLVHG